VCVGASAKERRCAQERERARERENDIQSTVTILAVSLVWAAWVGG